jgi:hypothetical protein
MTAAAARVGEELARQLAVVGQQLEETR